MLAVFNGRWKQIEPMLFICTDGERAGLLLAFKENKQGDIAYIIRDNLRVSEKIAP